MCLRPLASLLGALTTMVAFPVASAQSAAAFRYGAEPIFIPSEMPPVVRTWRPVNRSGEPGIKQGPPFEAALVRVFHEDTDWSSEVAVFRFRDGSVRAWKTRSFLEADLKRMKAMKAKAPVPPADNRRWATRLEDHMQKTVEDGSVHLHETRHFAFLWGNNPEEAGKAALHSPQFIGRAGEWFEKVWNAYEVDFQAPMPYARNRRPERIVVNLYGTGVPGVGSGWANSAKQMALDPRAMLYGKKRTRHLVYGVWTKNRRDGNGASEEDPLETTIRLGRENRPTP